MKFNLAVNDIFVQDVLNSMSESWGTKLFKKNNHTKLYLPDSIGSGFVKSVQFASGIGYIQTSYVVKEDLNFTLENNLVHPLKIIFNIGDTFYHKFNNQSEYRKIEKFEGAIVSNSNYEQHQFQIPANKSIEIFSIEINRKLFEHKLSDFVIDLDKEIDVIFRDVNGVHPYYAKFKFSLDPFERIQDLIGYEEDGFFASLHRESITYYLLNAALQSFLLLKTEKEKIADVDLVLVNKIIEISQFIEDNLSEFSSISKISKRFDISIKKMQQGFQSYYHCSVNDFIQRKRLEIAKKLLDQEDFNISEIAFQVGLNSKSYFSKLFKDRYGVSPMDYRKTRIKTIRHY